MKQHFIRPLTLALFFALTAIFPSAVFADTWYVDYDDSNTHASSSDADPDLATYASSCRSVEDGHAASQDSASEDCSLRAVIDAINAEASGDHTVYLPGDTITLQLANAAGENLNATGDIDITYDQGTITIIGQGSSSIIDGNGATVNDRVFHIVSADADVTLQDLTITGGFQNTTTDYDGGGIYNAGSLTLDTVVVTANQSTQLNSAGGGIYSTGTLDIDSSTISSNTSSGRNGDGAGIFNSGTATITNSTISSNSCGCYGGNGAGVFNSGTVTITNTEISSNTKSSIGGAGGGLANGTGGNMYLTSVVIELNESNSTSGDGGGIFHNGNSLTLDNSTVDSNSANVGEGGGLLVQAGTVSITDSIISNNSIVGTASADRGGDGISIINSTSITITNTTITTNSGGNKGAGVIIDDTASAVFSHVTIAENELTASNSTADGAGVYNSSSGTVTFKYSIIADNTENSSSGAEFQAPDCISDTSVEASAAFTSGGYNILSDTTNCTWVSGTGDQTDTDPSLGLLADNGGDTQTHSIGQSSAAVNQIPTETCEQAQDQIGQTRAGYCDVGAFEYQDSTNPVITVSGDNPLTLECAVDTFEEPGYSASDDTDGDVTAYVQTDDGGLDDLNPGAYTVTYSVDDLSENTGTATRTVNVVDTTDPSFTYAGDTYIEQGVVFSDNASTASDLCDPSPSISHDGGSAVDVNTPGTYTVTYTIEDGEGNSIQEQHDVTVVGSNAPSITLADFSVDEEDGTTTIDATVADADGDAVSYSWVENDNGGGNCVMDATTTNEDLVITTLAQDTADYTCQYTLTATDQLHPANQSVTVTVTADDDAPTANAGTDEVSTEEATVSLDGSGSSDPEGQALTYTWTDGDTNTYCSIADADTATPDVTFGDSASDFTCTYDLVVNDGTGDSTADSMTIEVAADNDVPTASAGADATVDEEDGTATLDGSGSNDPESQALTYSWVETADTTSSCALADATLEQPTVNLTNRTSGYTCTFELTVNDGVQDSASDSMTLTVTADDDAPTAAAGDDISVNEGDTGSLDASGSSDPEGQALTYAWTEEADTLGACSLSDATLQTPTVNFSVDTSEDYTCTYSLVVTDTSANDSTNDEQVVVTMNAANDTPVVSAGDDETVNDSGGTVVVSTATASDNDADDTLTYSWAETADAQGACALTAGGTTLTPTITITDLQLQTDHSCTYELTVNDGETTATDTMDILITATNEAPIADGGGNVTIAEEAGSVTLDGTGSSDPESYALTYTWTETVDTGDLCTIADASTSGPTVSFAQDQTASYTCTYELEVSDGQLTDTDEVTITVTADDDAPTANAGANVTVDEGGAIALDGSGSSDSEGQVLTYAWTEATDTGNYCTISGETTATPTVAVLDTANNFDCFYDLVVNDGTSDSSSDQVRVRVRAVNDTPVASAGDDATVLEAEGTAQLDATGSTDADVDDTLTYSWATEDTECSLDDDTAAEPTVTFADTSDSYTCTYTVTVSDGTASSDDAVVLSYTASNDNPVASAGADQAVTEDAGSTTLNASASSDADTDDTLTYSWTETADAENACALSSGGATATPTVTITNVSAASDHTCTYEVEVSDGEATDTDEMVITITTTNDAPTAAAGADETIDEADGSVRLDGTGSTDPEGQALTYAWTETADTGDNCTLVDASTATPTVSVVQDQASGFSCTYELEVSDGQLTATDSVVVNVTADDDAPTANAGADIAANEGDSVSLSGSGTDPEGQALTYAWTETADTAGACSLSSASVAAPSINFSNTKTDFSCTYSLVVNDATSDSAADTVVVSITADNDAPTADAGADDTATEPLSGDVTLMLDGSGSSDLDTDDSLTYAWASAEAACIFDDANSETPEVSFEDTSEDYTCTITLTVTDEGGLTGEDDVVVTYDARNDTPTVSAGADQAVNEGDSVTLTASGSDVDTDDTLTYLWSEVADTDGACSIDNAASQSTTITFVNTSDNFTCEFGVKANDGQTDSSLDTVIVSVAAQNSTPVASAGADQTVDETDGSTTLDGTASSDADADDTLTYSWSETADAENACALSSATSATPTVTVTNVGALTDHTCTFEVEVSDGDATDTDEMVLTISTTDDPPTANAGADETIDEADGSVQLSGSGSDPEGHALTYTWTETADTGDNCTLTDETTATPTVSVAQDQASGFSCSYELEVSDGLLTGTDSVVVNVTADDDAPTASAGEDIAVAEGAAVSLDATGSTDPENQNLSYTWSEAGDNTYCSLTGASTATPSLSFTDTAADFSCSYSVVVNDGTNNSSADTVVVSVTAANDRPTARAGSNSTVTEVLSGVTTGSLSGITSTDNDIDDSITYAWASNSANCVLSSATTSTPSISFADTSENYTCTFTLTVEDEQGSTDTDTVNRTFSATNDVAVVDAGEDIAANEGETVTLAGSATDADTDDTLTYTWEELSDDADACSLDDETDPETGVTLSDTQNSYTCEFGLVANDGEEEGVQDTVVLSVTAVNDVPVASAGIDQTVLETVGSVSLDASDSTDPDMDDTLTYSWAETADEQEACELSNATLAAPTVSITNVEASADYSCTFEVTVSDGLASSTDTVTVNITAINDAPTANAGADETIDEADGSVQLSGSGSDPEGQALTYSWTETADTGDNCTLADASTATPTVSVAQDQTSGFSCEYQLEVSDGSLSATDSVVVTVTADDDAPTVSAGSDMSVADTVGSVTLSGSASDDDSSPTMEWSITADAQNVCTISSGGSTLAPTISVSDENLEADHSCTVQLAVSDNATTVTDSMIISIAVTFEAPETPETPQEEPQTSPEDPETEPETPQIEEPQTTPEDPQDDSETEETPVATAVRANSNGSITLTLDDGSTITFKPFAKARKRVRVLFFHNNERIIVLNPKGTKVRVFEVATQERLANKKLRNAKQQVTRMKAFDDDSFVVATRKGKKIRTSLVDISSQGSVSGVSTKVRKNVPKKAFKLKITRRNVVVIKKRNGKVLRKYTVTSRGALKVK